MADSERQDLPSPPNAVSGVFQTSTVLIAAEGADKIYRSMDDVPGPLRTKLLKSTNSPNAATILIADRRGRREIARVMRGLGRASERLAKGRGARAPLQSMLAGDTAPVPGRLTQRRKFAVLLVVWALAAALIAMLFVRSWRVG